MNQELATALEEALHSLGDSLPTDWRRIVMVKNDGPIPVPPHPLQGDPDRGFNLLLLSARGVPTYYIRCRDGSDANAAREAELLRLLAAKPAIRPHLPEAAAGRSATIQVLAARYMRGELLAHLLPRMSHVEWKDALVALTDLVTDIGRAARASIPGTSDAESFDFGRASAEPLALLGAQGLTPERMAALEGVLRAAGSAERVPQHGDLWPGNIMRDRGVWRLLDFETFGIVDAPLFDAAHLTFTSTEFLLTRGRGLEQSWVSHIRRDDSIGAGARGALSRSAAVQGLTGAAAFGALVHYLIEGTARLLRREALPDVWARPFRELVEVADLIREGVDLAPVFFPTLEHA